MNQTVITGNLTADIETRELKSKDGNNRNHRDRDHRDRDHRGGDQHVSKFTIASNEGERVVFMRVEAWNMPHLAEYLFKGSKALVAGSLKQENWETEAGDKRSRIVLTAFRVEFLDPAPAGMERSDRGVASGSRREPRQSGGSAGSHPKQARESRDTRQTAARRHRAA